MSYHDIVKELIKKRAKAETGVYNTRMKEIATERATKEKFRRQNKEAEIGEEMFEDGTYEPLGERISTSKARDGLRHLAQVLVSLIHKGGNQKEAVSVANQMKNLVSDARMSRKLQSQIELLRDDITKLMESSVSRAFDSNHRKSIRGYLKQMTDMAQVKEGVIATQGRAESQYEMEQLRMLAQEERTRREIEALAKKEERAKQVYQKRALAAAKLLRMNKRLAKKQGFKAIKERPALVEARQEIHELADRASLPSDVFSDDDDDYMNSSFVTAKGAEFSPPNTRARAASAVEASVAGAPGAKTWVQALGWQ